MNRLLSVAVIICATITNSGCGVVAKVNARHDMEQSKAAYKACLQAHPSDVSACEGCRLSYDADMKAYRATSAGIQSGRNNTVNVNTSSDN